MKTFCHRRFSPFNFYSLIFILCLISCSSIHVTAQDDEPPEIINKIPKHIPLKVELENKEKKEVVKELRIKVTNSGDKPIYAIELFLEPLNLIAPETGHPYGFRLQYGIKPGSTIYDLAEKDDDALEPGESYIFQISKKKAETFRKGREKRNEVYPKQFKLGFQLITFGDGTGFHLGEGVAFPTKIGLKQNKNFDLLDFQTPNLILQLVANQKARASPLKCNSYEFNKFLLLPFSIQNSNQKFTDLIFNQSNLEDYPCCYSGGNNCAQVKIRLNAKPCCPPNEQGVYERINDLESAQGYQCQTGFSC